MMCSIRKEKDGMNPSVISIIVPAYNEEKTIGRVLSDTISIMDETEVPYEIIVVDDGSTDKTGLIASDYEVSLITNKKNRGKGYSLKKGLQYAHGDIIVTMDADGEHKPEELPNLIKPLFNGTDIVAGSRFIASNQNATSKLNHIGNRFFNTTILILTGKTVTDSQTGFRAIRRDVLNTFDLESDGYEIEAEITVKSLKNGFTFKETPITVERRKYNSSKLRLLSDGPRILRAILKSSLTKNNHYID
jgi:glycosyltransferase involved in cell wall biosynthesis